MAEALSLRVSWEFQGSLKTQERKPAFSEDIPVQENGAGTAGGAFPDGRNPNLNPVCLWQVGAEAVGILQEKSPSCVCGGEIPFGKLFFSPGSLVLVFLISLYSHQGIYINNCTAPPGVRAEVGKGGMPLTREPI